MRRCVAAAAALVFAAGAPMAFGQDSVALTPGGNDALPAHDASVQRTRYLVDLVQASTSWNNAILVAPIVKASRDTDPLFRTQILGSIAVSPSLLTNVTFASRDFATWTGAGAGVNPLSNAGGSIVSATGFRSQFGVGASDFSLNASSAVGAIVGRVNGAFNRLYVERVVAASSRATQTGPDTATVSLGGIDAQGNLAIRADNFNTQVTTSNRLLGDNILRVDLGARAGVVNTLTSAASVNTSDDTSATTYVISNESTPTNTPTILNQPGVGPFALAYDFAGRFRAGSATSNLSTGFSHIAGLPLQGHRGNPTFSTVSTSGGAGTVASIAMPVPTSLANRLLTFRLDYGSAGSPPTVTGGSPAQYQLPSPISSGSFVANSASTASFRQYLSQTSWRGGNGQVGVGRDRTGNLVLAATATDPSAGDFIAVANINSGGVATWSIAAYSGAPVLSGLNGASLGTLVTTLSPPGATLSAPSVDRLGNIYFIATWKPALSPQETALFKGVTTQTGYRLEALLRTGQTLTGANSTRPYTITSLTLNDSDSIASGSMFAQSIIQQQDPAATTSDPTRIRAFGGVVVSAVITYDNAGTSEAYDAVLYVGPTAGVDCQADYNGDTVVDVNDIFAFLAGWFARAPAANVNGDAVVDVNDIFAFLGLWFARCPG